MLTELYLCQDERLYLIMCAKFPGEPTALAPILPRLQISLEASYISPFIPSSQASRSTVTLNSPGASQLSLRPRGPAQIIPPTTPSPIPSTSTPDRQYAQADTGVILQTYVWGDSRPKSTSALPKAHPGKDDFTVAWSEEENSWIALYELHVLVSELIRFLDAACHYSEYDDVAFLQTRVSEPLLCLTASATLRDKPILSSASQEVVLAALKTKGISTDGLSPDGLDDSDEYEDILHGMEDVNLLENLNYGELEHLRHLRPSALT